MDFSPHTSARTPTISTTSLPIDVDALCQQFEKLKDAERERHELMETLLRQVKELSQEQEKTIKALKETEILANDYQKRFEAADTDLNKLSKTLESDSFGLVLINGDYALFRDSYIQDGLKGGERAAQDLRQALYDNCKRHEQYLKYDCKIVLKVYLDLAKLSKRYNYAKVSSSSISILQFVQGFNNTDDSMTIIDASNRKDGADSRVKGMLACQFHWSMTKSIIS